VISGSRLAGSPQVLSYRRRGLILIKRREATMTANVNGLFERVGSGTYLKDDLQNTIRNK
jgi:hypothetical protein